MVLPGYPGTTTSTLGHRMGYFKCLCVNFTRAVQSPGKILNVCFLFKPVYSDLQVKRFSSYFIEHFSIINCQQPLNVGKHNIYSYQISQGILSRLQGLKLLCPVCQSRKESIDINLAMRLQSGIVNKWHN